MAITTQKYIRKPLYVEAVRITPENFLEMAFWCKGSIKNNDGSETKPNQQIDPSKQYIQVQVHNPRNPRQTRAKVGDWILYTERGYKVYSELAFRASFDKVHPQPLTALPDEDEIKDEEHQRVVTAGLKAVEEDEVEENEDAPQAQSST